MVTTKKTIIEVWTKNIKGRVIMIPFTLDDNKNKRLWKILPTDKK